jgi:hypothetical protein
MKPGQIKQPVRSTISVACFNLNSTITAESHFPAQRVNKNSREKRALAIFLYLQLQLFHPRSTDSRLHSIREEVEQTGNQRECQLEGAE